MIYSLQPCAVNDPELEQLWQTLSAQLQQITGDDGRSSFSAVDQQQQAYLLRNEQRAVACCAIRAHAPGVVELKRMYSSVRGAGGYLLREIEQQCRELGYQRIILSTRKVNTRAVGFYQYMGYLPCQPYGKYRETDLFVCLAKTL